MLSKQLSVSRTSIESKKLLLATLKEEAEDKTSKILDIIDRHTKNRRVLHEAIVGEGGNTAKARRLFQLWRAQGDKIEECNQQLKAETSKKRARNVEVITRDLSNDLDKALTDGDAEEASYLLELRNGGQKFANNLSSEKGVIYFDKFPKSPSPMKKRSRKCGLDDCSFSSTSPQNVLRHRSDEQLHRNI